MFDEMKQRIAPFTRYVGIARQVGVAIELKADGVLANDLIYMPVFGGKLLDGPEQRTPTRFFAAKSAKKAERSSAQTGESPAWIDTSCGFLVVRFYGCGRDSPQRCMVQGGMRRIVGYMPRTVRVYIRNDVGRQALNRGLNTQANRRRLQIGHPKNRFDPIFIVEAFGDQ